jgi:hypothetical protein
LSRGTPVAGLIVLGSRFHFKPIEGALLFADPNLGELRPDFTIEAILVHAKEGRCVPQPHKARKNAVDRRRLQRQFCTDILGRMQRQCDLRAHDLS